jgi:hypothetical protein
MGRPATTKEFPRVHVRLTPELYEFLSKEATKGFRTINSEITLRLTQSMLLAEKETEHYE